MSKKNIDFSTRLLGWFKHHGRHNLPWQKNKTPYRVWVSEIMLQQTQVMTVIPYFQKFIHHFPNVETLGRASLDEVLALWSGLGYYARARNLHKTAKVICSQYEGHFPKTLPELMQLPGIGRSTAGAILSLAMNYPTAILDGNVKRILARFYAIQGPLTGSATQAKLWALSESLLPPATRSAAYTQAIMDLGATLCLKKDPLCHTCPLNNDCQAFLTHQTHLLPQKKPKATKRLKTIRFLIIQNTAGEVLLEKRPSKGIWGGLWCFPEQLSPVLLKTKRGALPRPTQLASFKHHLTHFTLDITPLFYHTANPKLDIDSNRQMWYNLDHSLPGGIAVPVQRLLKTIKASTL